MHFERSQKLRLLSAMLSIVLLGGCVGTQDMPEESLCQSPLLEGWEAYEAGGTITEEQARKFGVFRSRPANEIHWFKRGCCEFLACYQDDTACSEEWWVLRISENRWVSQPPKIGPLCE